MKRASALFVAAFATVAWSSGASAQTPEKDADAERLFREGQKLLQERRYGEACPKFEAAYGKDHQLGTLLNLAYCHKEQGATWVAWLEFKEAEVRATELKRPDRRDFARQRMAELEKSLSRAVIDRSPKGEPTEVLVDDRRVPEAEKGVPFAIEPGQRKVTFRAKWKKDNTTMVSVAKSDRPQHIVVPPMEDDDPVPVIATPTPEPPKNDGPPAEPPRPGATQRTIAIALGAVGIVGLGVGAVTGVMALSNDCATGGRATARCPGSDQASKDAVSSGESTAAISTVGFIAGGAALTGAVLLYLTAPKAKATSSQESRARVVPELGAGWAGVRGTF